MAPTSLIHQFHCRTQNYPEKFELCLSRSDDFKSNQLTVVLGNLEILILAILYLQVQSSQLAIQTSLKGNQKRHQEI